MGVAKGQGNYEQKHLDAQSKERVYSEAAM